MEVWRTENPDESKTTTTNSAYTYYLSNYYTSYVFFPYPYFSEDVIDYDEEGEVVVYNTPTKTESRTIFGTGYSYEYYVEYKRSYDKYSGKYWGVGGLQNYEYRDISIIENYSKVHYKYSTKTWFGTTEYAPQTIDFTEVSEIPVIGEFIASGVSSLMQNIVKKETAYSITSNLAGFRHEAHPIRCVKE